MSVNGSPSTKIKSARFPTSTVPESPSSFIARADTIVADRIAYSGVIPA
jgi:hypothetical protein